MQQEQNADQGSDESSEDGTTFEAALAALHIKGEDGGSSSKYVLGVKDEFASLDHVGASGRRP